jgi:hypothetical protein
MQQQRAKAAPFVGMIGFAMAAFLYGYAAIVLPGVLHSVVLPLLWLVLFVLACRWFTRRPNGVIPLAGLAIVAWFVVMLTLS